MMPQGQGFLQEHQYIFYRLQTGFVKVTEMSDFFTKEA